MFRIIFILALALATLSVGCGDDVMCVDDNQCVAACGEPATSYGCDPCPSGTISIYDCPRDGGSDATTDGARDATTDASDAGGDAADTSGPITCGDMTCGADEYCVYPCCGGAAPLCQPRQEDGTCPPGTTPDGVCFDGDGDCAPDPCTPDPPFCLPADMCTETDCSASGCFDAPRRDNPRTIECLCA